VLRLIERLAERLLPGPLHRAALRLAHALRKLWWRARKPLITGVVMIARDAEGRMLLVRHSYGSRHWTLPGGGLRKGEDPAFGAAREFREELGCDAVEPVFLGIHHGTLHGAPCLMHVFSCDVSDTPRPDGREIAEARFFALDALPPDAGSRVAMGVGMLHAASP
jgi:8-oxo-dGTP pyrophosphatase MutT (NUDIX family)